MKSFRNIIIVVPFIGITGLALLQHARLKHLTAESAVLRERLAQALARAEQPNPTAKPISSPGQQVEELPSSDLLRLRGQVAVLREQLADAVGSNAAKEAESAVQAQLASGSALGAAEADLKTWQEQAGVAEEKLAGFMAARQFPPGVSGDDAPASSSGQDLQSYLQAKQSAQEAERLVEVGKLKVARARARIGAALQPGVAK